jgi:hypothetical protein
LVDLWLHTGFCADRVLALRPDSAPSEHYLPNLWSLQGLIREKLSTSTEMKMASLHASKERHICTPSRTTTLVKLQHTPSLQISATLGDECGQAEGAKLFARAADLSTLCATSHAKPNLEAQTVSDKAGVRIEETARALAAGDKPRYQAWLWAADAAMQLLAVTVTKTSRTRNIALAVRYTPQKLAETDALATQAAALPAAVSSTSVTTDGGKRKGQNAPERSQRAKRKRVSGYYLCCFELFASSRGYFSGYTFLVAAAARRSAMQDTTISYSVTADVHCL